MSTRSRGRLRRRKRQPSRRGTLHGSTGLDGATVLVTNDKNEIVNTKTRADGTWDAFGLAPGKYRVAVQAEGFETFRAQEEVVANHSTRRP